MPRGSQGRTRPADVIGNAVHVVRITTREVEESTSRKEYARKVTGKARARKLTPRQRAEIAQIADQLRWKKDG